MIVVTVEFVTGCCLKGPVATFITWWSHTHSRCWSMKTRPWSGLLSWLQFQFRSKSVPSS